MIYLCKGWRGAIGMRQVVPLVCPHCGWQGTHEENPEVKLESKRIIGADYDLYWDCPACEMRVHEEDEE